MNIADMGQLCKCIIGVDITSAMESFPNCIHLSFWAPNKTVLHNIKAKFKFADSLRTSFLATIFKHQAYSLSYLFPGARLYTQS